MRNSFIFGLILALFMGGCSLCQGSLSACEGKTVEFEGEIANEVFQHMIDPSLAYKGIYYVDSERFSQIVVYSDLNLGLCERFLLKGTVIRLDGESKRPGSNEVFVEHQLIAEEIECLD